MTKSSRLSLFPDINVWVALTYDRHVHHEGLVFDGNHIWVANFGSNNVTKLRASDGAVLGTFSVGMGAQGMAFDGANIWVANTVSQTVSKL
jgi:DNA-binding beta-propeller fold protein YncE